MFRTIRYERGIEKQLAALGVGYARFDELMEIIDKTLSEHAHMFPTLPGTRISLCRTNEFVGVSFRGVPSLAIYFQYDPLIVTALSVERMDGDE